MKKDDKIIKKFIPESIANSQLFVNSLKVIIQFLKNKLKEKSVRFYDTI